MTKRVAPKKVVDKKVAKVAQLIDLSREGKTTEEQDKELSLAIRELTGLRTG